MTSNNSSPDHIVLFPLMSKGHTIPLLHFARILVARGIKVTIFTTKNNTSFIAQFLERTQTNGLTSIIDLQFPDNIEGIPQGIESTDKLSSISLFMPFVSATKLMQPHFEQELSKISNVMCIISDGFLSWTLASANKFGIPRLVFYGMNNYVWAVVQDMLLNRLLSGPESDDELIALKSFPWIKVTKNDFEKHNDEFYKEVLISLANSYGMITNSFYELEPLFVDYINSEAKPKSWCVGPLCLAETRLETDPKPKWIEWLDQKHTNKCSVLYVAFGTQAEISTEQLKEISKGLEDSRINFLWLVRKCESSVIDELKKSVGERGMIVTEWVDQTEILKHESVTGFLSHCGWNSVLESICAQVPILAWPMMADQHLNARMVVEEIKIGLRVETCDGSVRGFVTSDGLKKTVKELMEGENGKKVRDKVKELGLGAKEAMAENGSSWRTLNELIIELQAIRN